MATILFWIYLINATLLITHEIDSAYWEEWKLFGIPGGITTFLLLHLPILFFVLYGLILIHENTFAGLIFSFILAISGIFAFSIHTYFMRRGRDEFKTTISRLILISTLIISILQLVLTIIFLLNN
ncbi:MAG: DUF6713 family protein [Anaerolineales bacterium]|jgi:hypothetical protein